MKLMIMFEYLFNFDEFLRSFDSNHRLELCANAYDVEKGFSVFKRTKKRIMKTYQCKICYASWHPDSRYLIRYFLKNCLVS